MPTPVPPCGVSGAHPSGRILSSSQLCKRDYDKVYREKNRERRKQQSILYRQKNVESVRQRNKLYRESHRDLLREKERVYVSANRDKINERRRRWRASGDADRVSSKLWREENKQRIQELNRIRWSVVKDRYKTPKRFYQLYKHNAILRGHSFNLSVKDFEHFWSKPCTYCGGVSGGGLDRVDSSIGYVLSNVVPCCSVCNGMKLDLGVGEFLEHCKRITVYRGGGCGVEVGDRHRQYAMYKYRARLKGRPFFIEYPTFLDLVSKPCHYCGGVSTGLDRVDNSEGYVISNVCPCCVTCNMMKYNRLRDVFISQCMQISSWRN